MAYEVDLVTTPSRTLAVTRFHVAAADLGGIGARMGAAFGTVIAHLSRTGAAPSGPAVACYTPAAEGFDVAAGFPVAGPFEVGGAVERLVVGGGEVAHTTHLGPYEQLPAAYEALRAGAAARGRALAEGAAMWEEYWSGPETRATETRTEVFWPLAPAG